MIRAWQFAEQQPGQKRRLLNFLLASATWKDDELAAQFHEPFLLAEGTTFEGPRSPQVPASHVTMT
jgi:hypothetical protein